MEKKPSSFGTADILTFFTFIIYLQESSGGSQIKKKKDETFSLFFKKVVSLSLLELTFKPVFYINNLISLWPIFKLPRFIFQNEVMDMHAAFWSRSNSEGLHWR